MKGLVLSLLLGASPASADCIGYQVFLNKLVEDDFVRQVSMQTATGGILEVWGLESGVWVIVGIDQAGCADILASGPSYELGLDV